MPFPAIGSYGPYPDWSQASTYSEGDVVFYGGYLYRAMTSISAGDNPRTATFTCTFYNTSGISTSTEDTRTMRKWRIFDLPFSYYHAMLMGIPPNSFDQYGISSPMPDEIRTICAVGFATDGEIAVDSSFDGYGISAGLDVTYAVDTIEGVDNIELTYSFSAIPMDELEDTTYRDPTTNYQAIFWQTNTVGTGSDLPAWGNDCQGMMFASMQTFSREYGVLTSYSSGPPVVAVTNDVTTVAFQDNWTAAIDPMGPSGTVLLTDPNFASDT